MKFFRGSCQSIWSKVKVSSDSHHFFSLEFQNSSQINPFVPNSPFLCPLKASENLKVFWCFHGVEKGRNGNKWVNTNTCKRLRLINPFFANAPFLYPVKTSENRKVFWCFHGVEKKDALGTNVLIKLSCFKIALATWQLENIRQTEMIVFQSII